MMASCAGLALANATVTNPRQLAATAALPFPITHSRKSPPETWTTTVIREVTIRVAQPMSGLEAEALLHGFEPGIVVTTSTDGFLLTGWSWGNEDVVVFTQLMKSWGIEVHRRHTITEVFVQWGPGGPVGWL